jgi:hypothetical protein
LTLSFGEGVFLMKRGGFSAESTLSNQHHARRPTEQGVPPRFDFSFQLSEFQLFRSLPQPSTNLVVCFPSPLLYARPPAGTSRETARAGTTARAE